MLMREATPEMAEEWKRVYNAYKGRLSPNRKAAPEVVEYLKGKYPLSEVTDAKWERVIVGNVLENACYAEKLPAGRAPKARAFAVQNAGAGKVLYEKQDDIFKGQNIFVGVEMETAFYHVEGSSLLWDELLAFRGLDELDLKNYYLVAEYIDCLKKFDRLVDVLK